MISIFNGRKRTLGGSTNEVFAQVGVDFREHLHKFKGAKLGVFMAIALHSNEDGWAWPSYRLLGRETGYNKDTIARALRDLCEMTIDGHRVLLRVQTYDKDKNRLGNNRYLLFPSSEECARYQVADLQYIENQDTANQDTAFQDTGNHDMNQNHIEPEPYKQEPEKAEPTMLVGGSISEEPDPVYCSIHKTVMTERSKNGATWYSHKTPDGQWCNDGGRHNGKPREPTRPDTPCGIVLPEGYGCPGRGWNICTGCGFCDLLEGEQLELMGVTDAN